MTTRNRSTRSRTAKTRCSMPIGRSFPAPRGDVLRDRVFKVVFFGAFASNIGSWMQNAVLMGYAYTLTHSATYVGLIVFAQLGPLLLLSAVGGWVADVLDRKKLLIWVSVEQALFSVALGFVVRGQQSVADADLPDGARHRHRPGHLRAGVQRAAPVARRTREPGRRHLAQLGPDERLARHRPGHRRRAAACRRCRVGCSSATPSPTCSSSAPCSRWRSRSRSASTARSAAGISSRSGLQVARTDRVIKRCLITIFLFSALRADVRRPVVGGRGGEPRHRLRLGRLRTAVRDLRRRCRSSVHCRSARSSQVAHSTDSCASACSGTP